MIQWKRKNFTLRHQFIILVRSCTLDTLTARPLQTQSQDLMVDGVEGMFCLMDADKFKSINDNYGHDVGDKVIKAIAECLKKTFRNTDITMRLGGDEFAVYVVGVMNEINGEFFIENFFEEIDAIKIPELGKRKITISLGAAFFNVEENLSFAEVYKRADSAAYESKKFTGNHYTFY